jgi:hypothetical protein
MYNIYFTHSKQSPTAVRWNTSYPHAPTYMLLYELRV